MRFTLASELIVSPWLGLGMTDCVLCDGLKMILLYFDHYKAIGRDFYGKLALLDFALFGGGQFRGLADFF